MADRSGNTSVEEILRNHYALLPVYKGISHRLRCDDVASSLPERASIKLLVVALVLTAAVFALARLRHLTWLPEWVAPVVVLILAGIALAELKTLIANTAIVRWLWRKTFGRLGRWATRILVELHISRRIRMVRKYYLFIIASSQQQLDQLERAADDVEALGKVLFSFPRLLALSLPPILSPIVALAGIELATSFATLGLAFLVTILFMAFAGVPFWEKRSLFIGEAEPFTGVRGPSVYKTESSLFRTLGHEAPKEAPLDLIFFAIGGGAFLCGLAAEQLTGNTLAQWRTPAYVFTVCLAVAFVAWRWHLRIARFEA